MDWKDATIQNISSPLMKYAPWHQDTDAVLYPMQGWKARV